MSVGTRIIIHSKDIHTLNKKLVSVGTRIIIHSKDIYTLNKKKKDNCSKTNWVLSWTGFCIPLILENFLFPIFRLQIDFKMMPSFRSSPTLNSRLPFNLRLLQLLPNHCHPHTLLSRPFPSFWG